MNKDANELHFQKPGKTLSLNDAMEEGTSFLDSAKEMQEESKALKKEIENYRKKRKLLEQSIEKAQTAYQEFTQSLEAIEESKIYKRKFSHNHLKCSGILKNSQFSIPSLIDSIPKISDSITETIKKISNEYKQAKSLFESICAMEKASLNGSSISAPEIEQSFDLYEKKVNYTQSKMAFSLFVNKMLLDLTQGVFREIESIQKNCWKFSSLFFKMKHIVKYQYNFHSNIFSSALITKELKTFNELYDEELERRKRIVSNEFRPSKEKYSLSPSPSPFSSRKIPHCMNFLYIPSEEKALLFFYANFQIDDKIFRGSIIVYKKTLIIYESMFGWQFLIQKKDIFFFRKKEYIVEIETKEKRLILYCKQGETEKLTEWMYTGVVYPSKKILLGEVNSSVEDTYTYLFNEETDPAPEALEAFNVYMYSMDKEHKGIRKRSYIKRFFILKIDININYQEIYLLQKKSEKEAKILIYSTISLFSFFPIFSSISKISLQADADGDTNKTKIFYSQKQAISRWFVLIGRFLLKETICSFYSSQIRQMEGVCNFQKTKGYKIVLTSMLVGVISAILCARCFHQLFHIIIGLGFQR
ncbi:hypothetical protein NEFER03_1762 [Nematocida sp. LUAm3]|nr:hypothetical protein NEFER03_1762 [Nematocida sp. LUAm3]KAI5173931.1 hypothetical protein NEFER02_0398 [Nematocida sp. LUAm2]KAI5177324.1 hypothetical protein NEFER01_0599 [Nematocida sp. LUAm1]